MSTCYAVTFIITAITLVNYIAKSNSTFRRLSVTDYSGWINVTDPGNTLPRADHAIGGCQLNDTIFLFGGYEHKYALVEFNITSQTFTDRGESFTGAAAYGGSPFITQIGPIVYWIDGIPDPSTPKIIKYNLLTHTHLWQQDTGIPINVTDQACLASYNDLLFVVGGFHSIALNALQMYNITSKEWTTNLSTLQTPRFYFSCIVHPKTQSLYAIGGFSWNITHNGNLFIPSIEKININPHTIQTQTWSYVGDLPKALYNTASVVYGDSIIVIGGASASIENQAITYTLNSAIYVINCINDQISFGGSLSYAVRSSAVVIANQRIYAFGGFSDILDTDFTNTWQYLDLPPTMGPTASPTSIPSTHPTFSPTINPTAVTFDPSISPSNNPTISPTPRPTLYAGTPKPTLDEMTTTQSFSANTNILFRTTELGKSKAGDFDDSNIIIICVIVVICCVVLVVAFYFQNRHGIFRKNEIIDNKYVQLVDKNVEKRKQKSRDDDVVAIVNQTDIGDKKNEMLLSVENTGTMKDDISSSDSDEETTTAGNFDDRNFTQEGD